MNLPPTFLLRKEILAKSREVFLLCFSTGVPRFHAGMLQTPMINRRKKIVGRRSSTNGDEDGTLCAKFSTQRCCSSWPG